HGCRGVPFCGSSFAELDLSRKEMGDDQQEDNYKRDSFHCDTQLSMTNLDSFTRHRLANGKRVARLNYGPGDCHKQRKVASFRKNQCVLGLFGEIQTFSDCAESLHEPWENRLLRLCWWGEQLTGEMNTFLARVTNAFGDFGQRLFGNLLTKFEYHRQVNSGNNFNAALAQKHRRDVRRRAAKPISEPQYSAPL